MGSRRVRRAATAVARFKMSSFKQEHAQEKRAAEAKRIRSKYPDRIPVICEKAKNSSIPDIDKKKYLVPADLMSSIYEDQKDEDGFLYITYSGENTFGADLE